MNKHTVGRSAAAKLFLLLMVAAICGGAAPADWKSMITIAKTKRDAQGKLLPLQSYDETIRRGMAFVLEDHLKWFKGPAETLLDEKGHTQMPWVYYSNLQHHGAPFPGSVDRFVSYPAFHHALLIRTFIGYWRYAKDARALEQAVKLADWNIAHSTPGDWAYGKLPYSTFQEKKPGGFRDKTGLMPDKAAIMALAYLQLHEATREARFLRAAEAIGHTLSRRQRANGTWPFRVDPKTEKVIEEYTSSVIYAVMLFESLDKINGNDHYRANRDLAWNWLLNGPVKTKEFRGFYEDIPASTKGRTNYDCLDTIRYLLANRTEDNGYLELAIELNAWVEKVFLDKIPNFAPAEGIREQLQCNVVMGIHSLNWASMLRELAEAADDEVMRQRAIQTANYITYYLQPDNRIVVGFQYHQWWYSCHTGVVLYLLDFVEIGRPASSALYRHYKFDTLIENGAATPDVSPHKAHARLSGQELCEGVIGKALRFKAGNKGVVLGDLGLQAPATLCFWLKTDSSQGDGRILSQLEGKTSQSGSLRLTGGSLTTWNAEGWPVAVNGLSSKGLWQHVAVVFKEDGTVTGYLNGKKVNTFRSAFDFKGVKAGIGARFIGLHGVPFIGALDDLRIYSSALTGSEIKAMYPPELFSRSQAAASKAAASKPITPLGKLAKLEAGKKPSQTTSIINGTDWLDMEGRPIQAHDGHITRVKDTFYWYGSSYAGNPKGIYGTAGGFAVWNGIQVYSSEDLVKWTYRGVALPRPKKGWGVVGSVGRAHVIYNEKTRKHVMWYWYHTTYPTVFVMVATSDTPVGPFKVMGAREVGSQTGFGSDLNVFKDDDGKAYLVYTDHHTYDESKRFGKGKGVYAILVDSLTDDYLKSNKEGVVAIPSSAEAPAMIKHRGKYIVAASGVKGWNPTETRYVLADSPLGPYSKPGVMTEKKTWGGQITSFLYIKESDTLMAMCDQWWIPDKKDLNKSRYLWLPVYVNPQTGAAKMTFHEKWNPFSKSE